MSYLSNAKQQLIDRAIEIYTTMRDSIPTSAYPNHFKNMGEVIARIDRFEDLASLMIAVCRYDFDELGIACTDSIEEFLQDVFK